MTDVVSKSFEKPDDAVGLPKIARRVVELGDVTVAPHLAAYLPEG